MAKRRPAQKRTAQTSTAKRARKSVARRSSRPASRAAKDSVSGAQWRTALTSIEPNKILVRGYALDEMMGRVSFGEAVYLMLTGELPSRDVGRLVEALLVSSIDHGTTPPSTLATRTVATTGAPIRAAAAAGILALGSPLGGGGNIARCIAFLDEGLALVGEWVSYDDAARRIVEQAQAAGQTPPGFGHRFHTRDPRAARLLQMALELDLESRYLQLIRSVERVLAERRSASGESPLPVNADGAIAAVCADLGLDAKVASALFMVSRLPGIVAHAVEEQQRQPSMRQIDPSRHLYDGPDERRLPDTRR